MAQGTTRSVYSSVFIALLTTGLFFGVFVGGLLTWDRQHAETNEARRVTQSIATTLSLTPVVRDELEAHSSGASAFADASARLQGFAGEVIDRADISYVTIMTPAGIRYTHRDPSQIEGRYIGTIPETQGPLTEVFEGTLGPSIRTITPVTSADGVTLLGWVSAGVTLSTVGASVLNELPAIAAITVTLIAVGVFGAFLGRGFARRLAGDLTPAAVRNATSSYESLRTISAAMRAQNHEHGNRLHTAVALLELGRIDEAIDMLTETAHQNQGLVDHLASGGIADPTMSALILGKAAQARELGVEFIAEIDPNGRAPVLNAVDAVSVMGNLIDNGFDAAVEGPPPRTVHVQAGPTANGETQITVTDSGPGFTAESRERMFEEGYSTKAARGGRGIGLALVRAIVENAGGSIRIEEHPTTIRVALPTNPPTPPRRPGRGGPIPEQEHP